LLPFAGDSTGAELLLDKPQVTAWGELIRAARDAMTPKLSLRDAAKRAGISPENWGHVERGYQLLHGRYRAAPGTPSTVAHMARVVGVSPTRLRAAGNDPAAEILEEMLRASESATAGSIPSYDDPTLDYLSRTPGLPDDVVRGLIVLARNWREEPQSGSG
jgi:hypothetical protein